MTSELAEMLVEYQPQYFQFPEQPTIILIDGYPAHEYVSATEVDTLIQNFSPNLNINSFDSVLINLRGGFEFAYDLLNIVGRSIPTIEIAYRESGEIVTAVPKHLKNSNNLVIDDVYDLGITGRLIQRDSPNSKLLYLTKKIGVSKQHRLTNCFWLSEIDNYWVLGKGMNGEKEGDGYPKDWGRNYKGIAAKILKNN